MFAKLLLLFTVVPAVELALLLWVGSLMGVLPTLALILVTALLGSVLARRQGLTAWRRLQTDLAEGRMPQDALFDGMSVLIAATLLVSPGVLSDALGIILMVPVCRRPIKAFLRKKFRRSMESGATGFISFGSSVGGGGAGASPFQGSSPFESPLRGSPYSGSNRRFDDGDVIDMNSTSPPKAEHSH